ncbi:histidine phosphatase family protein [Nocardioides limicola]|uniref:histidine phosphatase family protein n=1 Tax=Nocardioides limicola TaxID=2803368 RepID=UPI00193BC0D1|nr:histidine phosphatase family protein [Nocardioides sp. DJM-14]
MTLLLARHAQASWGADHYDALSDLGHVQSQLLGEGLAARDLRPDLVVSGSLTRHAETVDGIFKGAGWDLDVAVDEGWNEFDHENVIEVYQSGPRRGVIDDDVFLNAIATWQSGTRDHEYAESWPDFAARVAAAMERTVALAPSGRVLVVTSGGPIGSSVSRLLTGSPEGWLPIAFSCVNASLTKLARRDGNPVLFSLNEHSHLGEHVTHR